MPIKKLRQRKTLKDPNGELTAAGRAYFKKTVGANLKPAPKIAAAAKKLADKGTRLLERYRKAKSKGKSD